MSYFYGICFAHMMFGLLLTIFGSNKSRGLMLTVFYGAVIYWTDDTSANYDSIRNYFSNCSSVSFYPSSDPLKVEACDKAYRVKARYGFILNVQENH